MSTPKYYAKERGVPFCPPIREGDRVQVGSDPIGLVLMMDNCKMVSEWETANRLKVEYVWPIRVRRGPAHVWIYSPLTEAT